jgi:hypothetical protein
VLNRGSVTNKSVRTMMYRIHPAFIASLSAIAVMLAANATFARSATTPRGAFASTHPTARTSALRPFRHHHRFNNAGTFWPAVTDGFYGSSNGDLTADVAQPPSGDIHYTSEFPWDWAHQYPPILTPSGRPYVPSCPTQTVTVPGHGGQTQSVNITQCF